MLKKLLKPMYVFYKQKKEFLRFKIALFRYQSEPKIVVGSCSIYNNGWIPTEEHFLNLLDENDWTKYFKEGSVLNILAEHVWEHLSLENGGIAARTCYKFLKKGGKLRVAVPDGFHFDKKYIDYVKPDGNGIGADDHKVLYDYKLITEAFSKVGFRIELLEYFDETKKFHSTDWDSSDGHIHRSIRYDGRNKDGKPNYTSLIIDAVKE